MKSQKKSKSVWLNILFFSIITVVLVIFLEGAANIACFISKLVNAKIAAENIYTEYDSELGWVSKKNQDIKNMYGKGIFLKTNSQRFRNSNDVNTKRQPGKKRWIFAGDSFTFGYGVDNDHCFCSKVAELRPEIEYVNMGQGGYGCDQVYIWYMRDGVKLDHDVLVFAFVTDDFNRMRFDKFIKYPKPYLDIENDQVVEKNVPVPERPFLMRNFPRFAEVKDQLGLSWLTGTIASSANNLGYDNETKAVIDNEEKYENIVTHVFNNLNNESLKNNRTTLFVHLPTYSDYYQDVSLKYRDFLRQKAQVFNWNYLDLTDDLRKIRNDSIPLLFIPKDIPGYLYSAGHYTVAGNEVIAKILISKILQNPKISGILANR